MVTPSGETLPDLVVDNLVANSSQVTVTIRNAGSNTVSDAFWVDVYFNPGQTPGLNQPWDTIAPAGAVWGVTRLLAPGESLTLTVGDAFYFAGDSSSSFPIGATVYALVDSTNYNTNYGNILESNEGNNVFGPVLSAAGSGTFVARTKVSPIPAGLPQR